ncbi:MAG: DUF86 domain-containing protein [bacterium]
MKIDRLRVSSYLMEIESCRAEIEQLLQRGTLKPDSLELKAAKYLLLVTAEAISGLLQHLLARCKGVAAGGYLDTLAKAQEHEIISERLAARLKPFLEFRNSLIHRYWKVDDEKLIENIRTGCNDFTRFTEEIQSALARLDAAGGS